MAEVAEKIAMGPFGSNIKVETFVSSGIPVISGTHLNGIQLEDHDFNYVTVEHADRLKNSNVYRGDVIFTHAGNIGQVAYIPHNSRYERYVLSQRQFYLRCDKSKLSPEYITYFFKSREGQHKLLANASQTGVPSIAQPSSYLKSLSITLPPLPYQQKIVDALSCLDAKIDLLRRQNKTLETIAQTLFKRWFVEFNFPNTAGKPYKESGGKMLESQLGEVPEGWAIGTIEDFGAAISDFVANGSFASLKDNVCLYETPEYALFIRNTDLKSKFLHKVYADQRSYNFLKKTKLFGGEIIISNVGDVGSVYFCPYFDMPMTLGNNVIMLKSDYQAYLYTLFISIFGQFLINSITGGSAQPKFNKTDFRRLQILVPDTPILKTFEAFAKSIYKKISKNDSQIQNISQLRDSLLPKLMNGELFSTYIQ